MRTRNKLHLTDIPASPPRTWVLAAVRCRSRSWWFEARRNLPPHNVKNRFLLPVTMRTGKKDKSGWISHTQNVYTGTVTKHRSYPVCALKDLSSYHVYLSFQKKSKPHRCHVCTCLWCVLVSLIIRERWGKERDSLPSSYCLPKGRGLLLREINLWRGKPRWQNQYEESRRYRNRNGFGDDIIKGSRWRKDAWLADNFLKNIT